MKWYRFSILAAALLLCSCDRDEVFLAFNTQNVASQKFVLEASLNALLPSDSANPNPESMRSQIFVKTTSNLLMPYDDGTGRFEMIVDSVNYKSDKRSVDEFRNIEKYLSTQNFQFKLASDGSLSDPVIKDAHNLPSIDDLNLIPLFLKVQPSFPGSAVQLGDSWNRQIMIRDKGRETAVYKYYTLQDLFIRDGVRFAKIAVNLKYKEIPDSTSKVLIQSSDFVVGSGSILFDVTHGLLSSADFEINGDLDIRDLIANDSIPNMHVIQSISLRSEF